MTLKLLNSLLKIFVFTSLVVMAFVIILLNYQLMAHSAFDISVAGFRYYLSVYSDYKDLFVVAIAGTAAYIALQGLQQTVQSNRDRTKQERYIEWKALVDLRITEVEKPDPLLRRVFYAKRLKYFNFLFDRDFQIQNKEEMAIAFAIFADGVNFLEQMNEKALAQGQAYPDQSYSYAIHSFSFVFFGALDIAYLEAEADLRAFFVGELKNRLIDEGIFWSAVNNNSKHSK